jgi:hypothetical protein
MKKESARKREGRKAIQSLVKMLKKVNIRINFR